MIKNNSIYFFVLLLVFILISNITENYRLEGFYNDKRSDKEKNDMMIGFLVVGSVILGGVAIMALYNPLLYLLKINNNNELATKGQTVNKTRHIHFYEDYLGTNNKNININQYSELNENSSGPTTAMFIGILLAILAVVVLIQTGIIAIPGMQVFFYP